MDTRLLPPPPPERPPKSGTEVEWSRWIELDETEQMADVLDCMEDMHTALTELRHLVQRSRCDEEKKKWLLFQLSHINKHIRTPLEMARADMLLRNN